VIFLTGDDIEYSFNYSQAGGPTILKELAFQNNRVRTLSCIMPIHLCTISVERMQDGPVMHSGRIVCTWFIHTLNWPPESSA